MSRTGISPSSPKASGELARTLLEILWPFPGGVACHPDSVLPRNAHCISIDSYDDTNDSYDDTKRHISEGP
jgi:hypothetical protein